MTPEHDPALVNFLQAHAPLPPISALDLFDQICGHLDQLEVEADQALIRFCQSYAPEPLAPAFDLETRTLEGLFGPEVPELDGAWLRTYAPTPPAAAPDLEERLMAALDHPLTAYLQTHAPIPPAPSPGLEERITAALFPKRPLGWWSMAAAGVAALLVAGLPPVYQALSPISPEPGLKLELPTTPANNGSFAVDPDTGLYEIRM